MSRHALSDEQWVRIEPLLPKRLQGRKSARGDRLFIDAVLFRAKTGIPWRDLPERFGPWKSVYKALRLMHNEITFVLTTGGHNAGIVSGPSHPRRRYQRARRERGDRFVDPETWAETTETLDGSWWPAWNDWLDRHMGPVN